MLFLCLTSTMTHAVPDGLDTCLEQMARGEQAGLAGLYHATRDGVYAFALSLLKNAHDAEDVMQETYLALWNAAGTYRTQGKPMAWVLTVARNLCLQKLRQRQRQADLPQEDWEPWLRAKEGLSTEERLLLEHCLGQLEDRERQVVVLHAVAGLKHREIAQLLELPLSTVLSRYARALKKLKHLYKEDRR